MFSSEKITHMMSFGTQKRVKWQLTTTSDLLNDDWGKRQLFTVKCVCGKGAKGIRYRHHSLLRLFVHRLQFLHRRIPFFTSAHSACAVPAPRVWNELTALDRSSDQVSHSLRGTKVTCSLDGSLLTRGSNCGTCSPLHREDNTRWPLTAGTSARLVSEDHTAALSAPIHHN